MNKILDEKLNVSLNDIVVILISSWKRLVIAGLLGAFLGISYYFFFGYYTSVSRITYTNPNIYNNESNNRDSFSLLDFKTLQSWLPRIALQLSKDNKSSKEFIQLYALLSNEEWWKKNVLPNFAISKADIRELGIQGKDFEYAQGTILGITIYANGNTKEGAISNAILIQEFIRTAGTYAYLENLFSRYENELVLTSAENQKLIFRKKGDLADQILRVKSLEELHRRFPGNGGSLGNQVVNPTDAGAKFLPLSTQIVAANYDLNRIKEDLESIKDREAQLFILKEFIALATPLLKNTYDGLLLSDQLIAVESKIRLNESLNQLPQREMLSKIHFDLLEIKNRFSTGFATAGVQSTTSNLSIGLAAALGFIGLILFMLLGLLVKKYVLNIAVLNKAII